MLIEIKNDVYFILSRLREIDENYQIFYNTKKKHFEVHNKGQIGDSYSLTVPYMTLDKRTLDLVRKTRVENSAKLFEEMERHNNLIDERREKELFSQAESLLRKI